MEGQRSGTLIPALSHYQPAWLASDAVAGVTLAAYAIPVSLAYASLAGLPPHYGIYCYLVGGFAYALLGTSRQLAVGPTAAISMVVGTTVAPMAAGDPTRWAGIASLTALVAAGIGVVAWLLRLSGLVSFISDTVLTGFKAGAALTIAMTQLPKLFGVPGGGDNFFERAWILCGQINEANLVVLGLGIAALTALFAGDRLIPGRPIALFVVIASILLVTFSALTSRGVEVVGTLPRGLPQMSWPNVTLRDVDGVLPLAAACFLLSYVESVSAARTLASRHGYEINPRQELLALGGANFAVGLSHGFPIAGGLSQSAVNDKSGAKSQLSLVFASATIAACLMFLTDLLHDLPNVVLAAIVLVAVKGLIDVAALRRLWRVSRFEFSIAIVALVGVLLLGILKGVLLAVVVSLLLLLAVASHPHVAFLGRIPGTRRYSDLERHPDNEVVPGVLMFRVESSLFYFNVEHVRKTVWEKIAANGSLRLVVCDLSTSPHIDVAGAAMLAALHKDLEERRIGFRVVDAHASVRDMLRAEGLELELGHLDRRLSLDQVITDFAGPSVC